MLTPQVASRSSGAMSAVQHLLWPRWRALRHARQGHGRRARLLLFGVLAVLFMVACFGGSRWLFARFAELEFLAGLVIQRVVGLVLTFFAVLLVFSSTITAFTTFYLADDLPLLISAPVPVGRLYLARLVETWIQASWMMLVFALPIVAGCGPALGAPWWFYGALPLLALPLTLTCTAAGCLVALLLARWLPARRTHDLLVVLMVLGFLALYIAFRVAEPGQFVDPEGVDRLVALVAQLKDTGPPLGPAGQMVAALFAGLNGEWSQATWPLMALFTGAGALCAIGAWTARGIYLTSWSLAQEGRTEGGLFSGLARLVKRRPRPPRYPADPVAAMVRRDTLVFFRTTGQWTQLLLVASLGLVYLFNFHHLQALRSMGITGPGGVFYLTLLLGGFVVITLAVRFLYPTVSLEGRGIWAVRSAPITADLILKAKARWGRVPMVAVAVLLAVVSHLLMDQPWPLTVLAVITAIITSLALTGLAVGLGALDPRFEEPNPARIASGIGGVLYMLLGLVYLALCGLLLAWPVWTARLWAVEGVVPSTRRMLICGAALMGLVLISWLTWRLPLKLGARRLEALEG